MSEERKDYTLVAHILVEDCTPDMAQSFMRNIAGQELEFGDIIGSVEEIRLDGARHLREF